MRDRFTRGYRRRRPKFREHHRSHQEPPVVQTPTSWQSFGRYDAQIKATYIDGCYNSMRYTGIIRVAA